MKTALLSIDLEFTNHCNIGCLICPRDAIKREKGFIKRDIIEQFAKEFIRFKPLVTVSGMGDPLLHPDLEAYISFLRESGFNTGLVVNVASLIESGRDSLKRIGMARPHSLTLSVPSLDEETLKMIYRGRINRKEIIDCIRSVREYLYRKVNVRVWTIITDRREDITELSNLIKGLGLCLWVGKIHSRGGNLEGSPLLKRCEVNRTGGCSLFLFHTFIAHNGDVLSCCHDLSGETAFARIGDGADEILRRKDSISERRPLFGLCKRCDEPLRYLRLPPDFYSRPREVLFPSLKIYRQ